MRRLALLVAVTLLASPAIAGGRPQGIGCSWPATLDSFNLAYPDTSADYWMTHFGAVPASKLVIRGGYPQARYFSFHAYDEAQRPVASIADEDIRPDRGSNPFVDADGRAGTYTVDVVFEAPPEDPEPNTVYAGEMENGGRNPAGWVIYRIYIPDDRKDRTGGVPLPEVTLVTADGNIELPLEPCSHEPPPVGDEIDRRIAEESYPLDGERHVPGTYDPPVWKRFYGTDREFRDWCGDYGHQCDQGPKMTSGFLANQQIAYLYARISREFGDVVVVRLKPPTFPDTRAGEEPSAARDVRYWSLCQNNDATQRVVECAADHETVVGTGGYATFAISDPEDRPRNATRAHGVNWLPWGGAYYTGVLIYRHMLPARGFDPAIQRIPEGTDPGDAMRGYLPDARYCTTTRFERTGPAGCA
ncbi:MAG: hypothetical protein M3279_05065 [Actinomycetota bacterium]|nr:hypothetical protein [Actinomycetota bacterium]